MNKDIAAISSILLKIKKDYPISSPDEMNNNVTEIRKTTKIIWQRFHHELMEELHNLNEEEQFIDMSLLWYECFKFPYRSPLSRKKNGLPSCEIGYFESDFNDISYHDAVLWNATENHENLIFDVDIIEDWIPDKKNKNVHNMTGSRYKLTFENLGAIFSITKESSLKTGMADRELQGTFVFKFLEIPPIEYFLNQFHIEKDQKLFRTYRMFHLECNLDDYSKFIIFAKDFKLHKESGQSFTIGHAITP